MKATKKKKPKLRVEELAHVACDLHVSLYVSRPAKGVFLARAIKDRRLAGIGSSNTLQGALLTALVQAEQGGWE